MSKTNTAILYILIFIFTTFFSILSQRNGKRFNVKWFLLSFVIHWAFLAFTQIGSDYPAYYNNILHSSLSKVNVLSEPGFEILSCFLQYITGNPHIAILILKTLTLIIFYTGFFISRDDVAIWMSVLAYNVLLYLQGFYLLSEQIAIAVLALSYIYLSKKMTLKAVLFLFIACTLHTMCFLFVPIYIMVFFVGKKGYISIYKKTLIFLIYFVVIVGFAKIYTYLVSNIAVFQKYGRYALLSGGDSIGLLTIFTFSVLSYFVFILNRNSNDYGVNNTAFVFTASAFLYAILSYRVSTLLRINAAFIGIYAYSIPYLFRNRKDHELYGNRYVMTYRSDVFVWTLFLFIRGVINLQTYMVSTSSGISNYIFSWPF